MVQIVRFPFLANCLISKNKKVDPRRVLKAMQFRHRWSLPLPPVWGKNNRRNKNKTGKKQDHQPAGYTPRTVSNLLTPLHVRMDDGFICDEGGGTTYLCM